MKKLILTILILTLLSVTVDAAENQSIIFLGSYSLDNITSDADSAYLYIFNNAILVDSTKVTAQDLQWGGCYLHAHICTNDSTDGWTGWWVYFGDSEAVQLSEWAIVATARDSSYALHAQVDSTFDTLVAASARIGNLEKISGDATAAENFETMLDGTGGQQLTLKRLSIDGANSTDGSFYVRNTSGTGTIFTTTSSGDNAAGLLVQATAGNNYGLLFSGSGSYGGIVGVGGSTAGPGMWLLGGVGGHALHLLGNTAGDGLYAAGGATGGDGIHLVGDDTGYDLNATLNLDDMSGSYDKDDFEDDFFETASDTTRIRLDSLFSIARSLLLQIDGGNELVDLDTLKWVVGMLDTVIDSLLSQGWAAVDACAGAGAYTCSLTVVDTTHDVTVSGVQVTVNNQTEDGTEYYVTSNSAGHAVLSLNDGDYRASAIGPPYVYASTDFTISGAVLHDSILGYSYVITSPPSADVATVYGYFISGGHDTLRNMDVTFELEGYAAAIDTSADALVTMKIVTKKTDGNGKVEAKLLKNENLKVTDSDTLVYPWWKCRAADPTWDWEIYFTIDNDSTTFNLGVESDAIQFRKR